MRVRHFLPGLAAAVAAALASPITSTADELTEPSTLQCDSSVPIMRVLANGDMHLYQHLEPETGANQFGPGGSRISTGWQFSRPVAGPDGIVYQATDAGPLRRYRWNGTGWDTFENGATFRQIDATGWERYSTAAYRNRITVDAEDDIYTVEPDGYLHWRSYDPATQTMTHRVIAEGWNSIDLIVAAGRGVIYARTTTGSLYRYRYHAGSQRFVTYGQYLGAGWETYDRILSAGGDILYGIDAAHTMYWYRFNEDTDAWYSTRKLLGGVWQDRATIAVADTCERVGTSVPAPVDPVTDPHAPVTLLTTADQSVHYSYVDSEHRGVHAELPDLSGQTPFGFAVIDGFTGITTNTSTAEYADGRVQLVANGTGGVTRANVFTPSGQQWTGTTSFGGYMATPMTMARRADTTLGIYALDSDYRLWERRETAANGPIVAWRPLGSTPLAHGRLTVVPTTNGVRVLGLGRNGRFQTATYENYTLSAWTDLGGPAFAGALSTVTMPDGTLQLFGVDAAGTVRTQRQTTTGFPGTWTALSGVTAAGSPSAIMAPDGTLQVVVRGADGYLYFSGQTAPGAGAWTPWRTATTQEETTTDPTALAVAGENTWVIAYIGETGAPRLLRRQPPVTARTAGPDFADIALTKAP